MSIQVEHYGRTSAGEQVSRYILTNQQGMKAVLLDYGAVLTELRVPDKQGEFRDVVWGYETIEGYEHNEPGFGSTIGRNANRIGGAQVTIHGTTYILQKNDGENNLHGGSPGYNHRMWTGNIVGENAVMFSILSPDGDQGFPGNAEVQVTYTLTEDNELRIAYEAKADQDTVMNLTNHSYFNLDGQESDSILEQLMWIDADAFTPTDAELIPTGEIRAVEGTPMDFRSFHAVGERIDEEYEPVKLAGGYDHNFVLNQNGTYKLSCKLKSEKSGILMEVYTDLPGMQVYTSNVLENETGKNGKIYGKHSAACFESQYFPDAVHKEHFASPVLRSGELYRTITGYKFTILK